jgi:aryl-alcohol dehydrogenase-like predicted oxidoreductase
MDYVKLGRTGLEVSRICLGCMSFGDPAKNWQKWTLDETASRAAIRRALDLGINFLDTANVYSLGSSEEIVGRAVKDFASRDDVVVATKLNSRMRPGPNGQGLSRRAIMAEIDNSLRRLQMDYVDLYQIHRWDPTTPIEETAEALHDVVKAGKARYIGASSMYGWQFAKAVFTQRQHGWTEFVSMQDHLNLINREEEREMLPFCADQKIAVLPWSPLARGRLTRAPEESTRRHETDPFAGRLYNATAEADAAIVAEVGRIAAKRGVPRAQVALAWVLSKPVVTAPIVGPTKPEHLDDAVAALALKLTPEEIAALEAPYVPHGIVGFQ